MLSFFAAAFGCSVLSANPEAGMKGKWIAVGSYGLANAAPYWILVKLGPKLHSLLKMEGFTIVDFVYYRFGLAVYIAVNLCSVLFMFICLTAELTSAANAFSFISKPSESFPHWIVPLLICFATGAYSLTAGFKASLITDRIQAPSAIVLLIIIVVGTTIVRSPAMKQPANVADKY